MSTSNATDFTILTEIEIEVEPSRVWAVLTDFGAYGEWNPALPSASGALQEGAPLSAVLRLSNGMELPFEATVQRCAPAVELCWVSEAGEGDAAIRAEHFFRLSSPRAGCTRLVHGEAFSGPFSAALKPMAETTIRGDYVRMNEALRARCVS